MFSAGVKGRKGGIRILVLLWSVPPPDLVDFGVSVIGSEVVKKHQKAPKSTT